MIRHLIAAFLTVTTTWSVTAQTYNFSTLVTFSSNGLNGANPYAGLIRDGSGNLYGTTVYGGPNSAQGTVFRVDAGTNNLTTLASFRSSGIDGFNPQGGMVRDTAGNLYGTASNAGPNGASGTVFRVDAGTNNLTTLASFSSNGLNGNIPVSGLVRDPVGNLYGTTTLGGANGGQGTVFRVDAGTNNLTTLATFSSSGLNGANPEGGLVRDPVGNLYGTTTKGGSNGGQGTVFRVDAGTNNLTTLATFSSSGLNGAEPHGTLVRDAVGNLYGTTTQGGANGGQGTVFRVDTGTNNLTTLATFSSSATNGALPYSGLILDAAGNLYGTTSTGGVTGGTGTVFRVDAGTNNLTTLYKFSSSGLDDANPYSDLIFGADGVTLYGTTFGGGPNSGVGTVFALTPVPEPVLGLGLAVAGLGLARWVRRRGVLASAWVIRRRRLAAV